MLGYSLTPSLSRCPCTTHHRAMCDPMTSNGKRVSDRKKKNSPSPPAHCNSPDFKEVDPHPMALHSPSSLTETLRSARTASCGSLYQLLSEGNELDTDCPVKKAPTLAHILLTGRHVSKHSCRPQPLLPGQPSTVPQCQVLKEPLTACLTC